MLFLKLVQRHRTDNLNLAHRLKEVKSHRTYNLNLPHPLRLKEVKSLALHYNNSLIAVLRDCEVFPHRKEERCARQWGMVHKEHPYQKVLVHFKFPQRAITQCRPLTSAQ